MRAYLFARQALIQVPRTASCRLGLPVRAFASKTPKEEKLDLDKVKVNKNDMKLVELAGLHLFPCADDAIEYAETLSKEGNTVAADKIKEEVSQIKNKDDMTIEEKAQCGMFLKYSLMDDNDRIELARDIENQAHGGTRKDNHEEDEDAASKKETEETIYEMNKVLEMAKTDKGKLRRYATKENSIYAQRILADLYLNGDEGFRKSTAMGVKWLLKATKLNDGESIFRYAMIYKKGDGIKANLELAREYFLKGAELGHIPCCYEAATMCFYGDGGDVDAKTARKLLHEAARHGYDERACFLYGKCLLNGIGGHVDEEEAKYWFALSTHGYGNCPGDQSGESDEEEMMHNIKQKKRRN